MMLFLIMLFTDLFMVGICFSVYGKATLYHDIICCSGYIFRKISWKRHPSLP